MIQLRANCSISAGSMVPSFCHWEEDAGVLNILSRPCGKIIGKPLEVHVAEAPVRFLAEELQVKVSAIMVVFGVYNVDKQLRITAPKRLPAVIPLQPWR